MGNCNRFTLNFIMKKHPVQFLLKHMSVLAPMSGGGGDAAEDDNNNLEKAAGREITAMIDVLDVNAFEIRGPEFSIRGVYPLTAMMNSVCCPNTQVS